MTGAKPVIDKVNLKEANNLVSFSDIFGESGKCNRDYTIVFTYYRRKSFFSFLRKKETYTQSKNIYIACCDYGSDLSCDENLIKYPDFIAGASLLENPWFKCIGNPSISSMMGYQDSGYGSIAGNDTETDALSTFCAFQKEKIYKVKLAIKSEEKNHLLESNHKLRVYASNNVNE